MARKLLDNPLRPKSARFPGAICDVSKRGTTVSVVRPLDGTGQRRLFSFYLVPW